MCNPVARYIARTYLPIYILIVAAFVGVTYQGLLHVMSAFWLLPISVAGTISACTVLLDLCFRREIEVLQCFGVSLQEAVTPLIVLLILPQFIVFAFVGAAQLTRALLVLILCVVSSIIGLAIAAFYTWRYRERAVVPACIAGVLAQVLLIVIAFAV